MNKKFKNYDKIHDFALQVSHFYQDHLGITSLCENFSQQETLKMFPPEGFSETSNKKMKNYYKQRILKLLLSVKEWTNSHSLVQFAQHLPFFLVPLYKRIKKGSKKDSMPYFLVYENHSVIFDLGNRSKKKYGIIWEFF